MKRKRKPDPRRRQYTPGRVIVYRTPTRWEVAATCPHKVTIHRHALTWDKAMRLADAIAKTGTVLKYCRSCRNRWVWVA